MLKDLMDTSLVTTISIILIIKKKMNFLIACEYLRRVIYLRG